MAIIKVQDLEKERNEIVEPLLYPELTDVVNKDVESGSESCITEGSVALAVLSTAIAGCGSLEFGTCVGFSAPTQAGIVSELGSVSLSEKKVLWAFKHGFMTKVQFALFGSILSVGAMIGAITSGRIADLLGRKGAMRISVIFCIIGWFAVYYAQGALMLDVGRISTGYGIGVLSYVVPVFIAEISPKDLRGCLTTINQLLICAGSSAAYIVGTFFTWRQLVFIGLLPCVCLLIGLLFIPESPRWLAKTGQHKEFQAALQRLRGKDVDISKEAMEIQDNIEALESFPKATFQDLFKRNCTRPIIVGVGLMVFQQLGGSMGLVTIQVFCIIAGLPSATLGNILMGSIQVPITVVGAVLMDRSGRRQLLTVSASGTCLGCFLTGVSFCLKRQGLFLEWGPILALSGILVYIGTFSIGMGAVPWVMMPEIFPLNLKGIGGSLVTLVNWFGSWAISYAFNFLMSWSSSGTFFLFAAASATTCLFVARVVPETKGRTLEEIQELMNL